MAKLAAAETQSDWSEHTAPTAVPPETAADPATAALVSRVRWLMIISGVTTLLAIAAVIGVVGYRIFHSSGVVPVADSLITLPKGARVAATTVAADRIVVTLEVAGSIEIRTFDVKTLQETGRIRFVTAP